MCSRLCLCLFLVSVTVELCLSGVLFMMLLDVADNSAVHVSVVVASEVISLSLSLFIDYVVTRVIALLGVLVMICASVLVISGVVVHVLFFVLPYHVNCVIWFVLMSFVLV